MDEGKLRADLDRGIKAEALLNDPLVKQAFEDVESQIQNLWRSAHIDDERRILRSRQLLHALYLVKRVFEDAMRDGKVAEHAFEEKRRGVANFLGDVWQSRRPRRP